ncbi:hypothetical protein FRC0497_01407 [Corynebacterium diphtheriae]|nr:hypothetical protein FRC0497_01407 [Corynebacterium diphtheriae]
MREVIFLQRSTTSAISAICLLGCVVACDISPSPDPNATLIDLAAIAHNDAAVLQSKNSALAQQRHADSEELISEIQRLCGTNSEGKLPESCSNEIVQGAVDKQAVSLKETVTESDAATRSAQAIVSAIGSAPSESLGLLGQQLVDLVRAGAAAPQSGIAQLNPRNEINKGTSKDDLIHDRESLKKALDWEYSAIYGLGVALAHSPAGTRTAVSDAITAHRDRVELLESSFAESFPNETIPRPEAAYEFSGYPEPHDAQSSRAFFDSLEADSAAWWLHALSESHSATWRALCASLAAQSAARR